MASLQLRSSSWRLLFNHQGKQFSFPVGEVDQVEAHAWKGRVEHLLLRLNQHLVELPPGCDIVTFLKHDGKPPQKLPSVEIRLLTLGKLRDEYLQLHASILDARTVADIKGHWKHLTRHFKEATEAEALVLANLQKYVMSRVREKVEPATAKKEIVTLRTCWNWAVRMGMLHAPFPNRGLRFPKGKEKPPFMTFAEVERRVATGESEALWESVFLSKAEVDELLECVRERALHPWVYPLFSFAAHTGARRSEMLRARVADVDLQAGTVLIREKKRRRDVHESTRRVPLSQFLTKVLEDWLQKHPGGPILFCHTCSVARSRTRSRTTGHKGEKTRASSQKGRLATIRERDLPPIGSLTCNQLHDHFQRVLSGTKWEKLTGYHALRHSFVSICAMKGIDQRMVQSWCGHMTAEMHRRYAHLYPSAEREAIKLAFG